MPTVPLVTRISRLRVLKALSWTPLLAATWYSSYRLESQGPILAFGEFLTAFSTASGESGVGAAWAAPTTIVTAAQIAANLMPLAIRCPSMLFRATVPAAPPSSTRAGGRLAYSRWGAPAIPSLRTRRFDVTGRRAVAVGRPLKCAAPGGPVHQRGGPRAVLRPSLPSAITSSAPAIDATCQ